MTYDDSRWPNLFAKFVLHKINRYSFNLMSLFMPKFVWPGSLMFFYQVFALKSKFILFDFSKSSNLSFDIVDNTIFSPV